MRDSEDSDIDFSEIKGQTMAWYKKVSQKRFKRFSNGYVWDKWIGSGYLLICLVYLFFVAHSYNYDLNYYQCGSELPDYVQPGQAEMCKNPFYKPSLEWRTQEYLPPGEYGQKPGPLFWSIQYVPLILLLISAGLNHLIHNISRNTEEVEE